MDRAKLMKELKQDEGEIQKVYLDHLNFKSVGIGHLCRQGEPEYDMEVGDPVSRERIDELFNEDIESVLLDCKRLYPDFDDFPEEAQRCIGNMMFNLGLPRLRAFKNMEKQVNARNWSAAGDEAMDSRWFKQVPARAARIVKRLKSIK